jgi:hypothetical protein
MTKSVSAKSWALAVSGGRRYSTGVPPGSGIYNVSNTTELEAAIDAVNAAGVPAEIIMAVGTYTVTDSLVINCDDVTLRGEGDYTDVIVQGDAMSSGASIGILLRINSANVTLEDFTLQLCRWHAVQVAGESGCEAPVLRRMRLRNTYQHLLKGTVLTDQPGVPDGLVEDCLFEYTDPLAPNWYTGGMDVHGGQNWIVRRNTFRNIASPATAVSEHAVHFWRGSSGNLVERNHIYNCDRGIGFGLFGDSSSNNSTARNNYIYHTDNGAPYADVGIDVCDSTNCEIFNNTIIMLHDHTNAIEYRGTTTGARIQNNLCNKLVTSRNGGSTVASGNNITNAQTSWFTNLVEGPYLIEAQASVVDQGATLATVTTDFSGIVRPQGAAYDIGADEFVNDDPTSLPLLQEGDITYLGSFTLPNYDGTGTTALDNLRSGGRLGVSADGLYLYYGGRRMEHTLAKILIPTTLGTQATIVHPLVVVPIISRPGDPSEERVGSAFEWEGQLIIPIYSEYDGSQQATLTHCTANTDLTGFSSGGYRLGTLDCGFYAGYTAIIPEEWRVLMGGPCLAGQACISIFAQTSNGPAAFVWDPAQIGVVNPMTAVPLVYYTVDHRPLPEHWTRADSFAGCAFPSGTGTILFVGTHGQGHSWYGLVPDDETGAVDPCDDDQGNHAEGYQHTVWAFRATDALRVKAGEIQPWEMQPYAMWDLPGAGSGTCDNNEDCGLAYCHVTRRMYFARYGLSSGAPIVHVYQVGEP